MLTWFRKLSLATQIVSVTVAILALVLTVNYALFAKDFRTEAQAALIEKAKAFSAVADEAKNHTSLLHRQGSINAENLASELTRDLAAGKTVNETRFFNTIPIVAGWTAAQEAAKHEQIQFRITAFEARNKEHEPKPGSFEEQLLRDLVNQVAAGKGDTIHAIEKNGHKLHFLRAIRLTENCLMCHGDPGNAWDKDKDGKDLTGHRMEGWKTGAMHGSYHVVMPLDPVNAQVAGFITHGLMWSAPLIAGALALLIYLVWRIAGQPVKALTERTRQIATGDLTQDVPAALRARKDEIGNLAASMQTMTENLRNLLREVSGGVQTLASSSTELSAVSSQTSAGVKAMAEKAATVAAAAEQSSANTVSVAAGMEQAATNLGSVAGATEEMSATVAEIAANSEKARAISEQASAQAQAINALMQQLGQAAREIGKVTETITDISSQTNLLALNATIEAARAGAAGKGFAVVANEIKELARQTAAATEDIKAKIGGVQHSAGSAITDIEQIAGVIREVGSIVASIAAAIEEQATVTKDVAGNIAQASAGVKEANGRVAQTAGVAKSIAQDIAAVNASVGEIREGGEQVRGSAAELSRLAEQLKTLIDKFQVSSIAGERASSRSLPPQAPAGDDLISWQAGLSVGVVSMDAHHQKLIQMINRLHKALQRHEEANIIKNLLKELLAYTQYHFQAEEALMAKANYPGLKAHRKAHAQFIQTVEAARDRWLAGDANVPQELMATLKDWLVNHITVVDKQYGPRLAHDFADASQKIYHLPPDQRAAV